MRHAGYVLVGGLSTRMGRDKALLRYRDMALAELIANQVEEAAGSVTLVGDPKRYARLGRPVIPDLRPGRGPLGGIEAALAASAADWNVIVACDMPGITSSLLIALLEEALHSEGDCVLPLSGSRLPEPLCAVYHRRCLPAIRRALDKNVRKVTESLSEVRLIHWKAPETGWANNLNTPDDWQTYGIANK